MLTKQDIQRIAEYMRRLSVRDTEFKKTSNVDGDTYVPVIQNNENRLALLAVVAAYVSNNIDLSSLQLNVDGLTNHTLGAILSELKRSIDAPRDDEGNEITAEDISYTTPEDDETVSTSVSVAEALTYLYQTISELEERDYSGTGLTDEQAQLLSKVSSSWGIVTKAAADFNANTRRYQSYDAVVGLIREAINNLKIDALSIENSLDSDDPTKALGADQGHTLKKAIMDLTNSLANIAFTDNTPYTAGTDWTITDGVSVSVMNSSSGVVYIRDSRGNEVSGRRITVSNNGTVKLYVTPRESDKFLNALSYSTTTGDSSGISIGKSNKKEAVITLTDITSDMTVTVTSSVRNAEKYNVTLPSATGAGKYVSFSETYQDQIIEGSTFETIASFDSLPSDYTITSFEVTMGNDSKTVAVDPGATSCALRWENVDGNIGVSITETSTKQKYDVNFYEAAFSVGTYTKTGDHVNFAYEGETYTCLLNADSTGSTSYRFDSVVVMHGAVQVPTTITDGIRCQVVVENVQASISVIVKLRAVQSVTRTIQLTQSAAQSGLYLQTKMVTVTDNNPVDYTDILSVVDSSAYSVPDSGSISLVDSAGNALTQGNDYDMFNYNKVDTTSGRITITGIRSDIYVDGLAVPVSSVVEKRLVTLKLMNLTYTDSNNTYITNNNPFGYPQTDVTVSDGYSVTFNPGTSSFNDDIKINIGGVTVFKEGSVSGNISGISCTTNQDGTKTVAIEASVFSNYAGKVNIIATANTETITVVASADLSNTIKIYDQDGIAQSFGSWEDYGEYRKGTITGITEIHGFTKDGYIFNFSGCSSIISIDLGGVPIKQNTNRASETTQTLYQLFRNCSSLISIRGMVVQSGIEFISGAFENCTQLTELDGLYAWDVINLSYINNAFGATAIPALDLEDWDTPALLRVNQAFHDTQFTRLYLGNFDTSNVTDSGLFLNKRNKTDLIISAVAPPAIGNYNWLINSSNKPDTNHINTPIYVPAGSKTTYEQASVWSSWVSLTTGFEEI